MLNLSVRSSSTTSNVPFDGARVELSPFAIPFLQREVEEHGRAAAFLAVDRDRAAVLLHDGLRDAQAQSGPGRPGGEEGVEQLRQRAARDADAGVDHAHLLRLEPHRVAAPPGAGRVAVAALGTLEAIRGAPPGPARRPPAA